MPEFARTLIAVDIGNSRIKLGRFDLVDDAASAAAKRSTDDKGRGLPLPAVTLEMMVSDRSGNFEGQTLADWCAENIRGDARWLVASVHRGAAEHFISAVYSIGKQRGALWSIHELTYRHVPMAINVDEPQRVGIDRLLAALAASRIRSPDRAVIVIDSGSATTIDLVSIEGAFCGGAILPGLAMAARALHEQTDALPRVALSDLVQPPPPLGTSTVAAIQSGLFWGAVGALRELLRQLSADLDSPPEVFISGGTSPLLTAELSTNENWAVHHVSHLVLAGIALSHKWAAAHE